MFDLAAQTAHDSRDKEKIFCPRVSHVPEGLFFAPTGVLRRKPLTLSQRPPVGVIFLETKMLATCLECGRTYNDWKIGVLCPKDMNKRFTTSPNFSATRAPAPETQNEPQNQGEFNASTVITPEG